MIDFQFSENSSLKQFILKITALLFILPSCTDDETSNKSIVKLKYDQDSIFESKLENKNTLETTDIEGKWIRKEVSAMENFHERSWPYFEYLKDSTFFNNQLDYSEMGVFWIADSVIYEVWPDQDTSIEEILWLNDNELVVKNRWGDILNYVRYHGD
jgi:hypothetical protein